MTRLSAGNERVKRLRKLCRRRSVRRDEGLFVLHGPTLLAEALAAREVALVEVFVSEPLDPEMAAMLDASGIDVFEVDQSALQKAVDVVTPQSVVATARLPEDSLDRVLAPADGLVLGLMGVGDPGNVGHARPDRRSRRRPRRAGRARDGRSVRAEDGSGVRRLGPPGADRHDRRG